jgi:prolyl-tRNA synthetase
MGCYGIGLERLLAACIEANHDSDGITWPTEVAPYDVHIVVLNGDQAEVSQALEELEGALAAARLRVLVDDREDAAGVKFKDADLLGMPARITVSPRALAKGGLEVRERRGGAMEICAVPEAVTRVRKILDRA